MVISGAYYFALGCGVGYLFKFFRNFSYEPGMICLPSVKNRVESQNCSLCVFSVAMLFVLAVFLLSVYRLLFSCKVESIKGFKDARRTHQHFCRIPNAELGSDRKLESCRSLEITHLISPQEVNSVFDEVIRL